MTHNTPGAEAAGLVKTLQQRGFQLEIVGDRLYVRPAGRLTEEERQAIRRLKHEILATPHQNGTNGNNGKTAQPESSPDDDLVEVLDLVERIRAVKALGFLDDLVEFARDFHQDGRREQLANAVRTARRVAVNVGVLKAAE